MLLSISQLYCTAAAQRGYHFLGNRVAADEHPAIRVGMSSSFFPTHLQDENDAVIAGHLSRRLGGHSNSENVQSSNGHLQDIRFSTWFVQAVDFTT